MISKKTAFRSVSYLWLGSILGASCAFVTQVVLARELRPEAFGVFSASLSMVMVFAPLAGFGIAQYWLKAFGQEGWTATRWLQGSFRYVCFSTTCVMLIIMLWSVFGPHDVLTSLVLVVLSLHVLGQLAVELVSAKLQLEERYLDLALWQVLPHLMRMVLVVILAYAATNLFSLQSVACFYAVVAFVFFISGSWLLFRMYQGAFKLKGHTVAETSFSSSMSVVPGMFQVASQSWPFGVAALFHFIYFQSDIILLKYMKGAQVAGLYNVAFTVMVAVYLFPGVIYQKYLVPKIHRWAHQDRARFYQIYRQGNIAMLLLGLLAMVVIWLLAPWGVVFLFGRTYQAAIGLLMVLAMSAPIIFVAHSVGATLVTQEHMKTKVKGMGVVAGVNLLLNFLLIPHYGALGAAIATVVSNLALLALYFLFAEKKVFAKN